MLLCEEILLRKAVLLVELEVELVHCLVVVLLVLTSVVNLYLLFFFLETGRVQMNSELVYLDHQILLVVESRLVELVEPGSVL